MKRHLYTLCFLLLAAGTTFAQDTLALEESTIYQTALVTDQGANDISAYGYVINHASEGRNIVWERTEVSLPDGWATAICDVNLCYTPNVSSMSYMQAAGDTSAVILHVYPNGGPGGSVDESMAGTAEVHVLVYDEANPSDAETIVFFVTLDVVSSITELERASLKLYPNPTQHFFKITENEVVKSVNVLNILGQTQMVVNVNDDATVGVSDLDRGMYLVQMIDENGDLVKTVRLMKE